MEKEPMESPDTGLVSHRNEPGFWKELWHQAQLVWYLFRDPEVPFYLKLLPIGALAYVLFPIDVLPDLWPLLGQLDDLTALLVGAKVFIDMSPPHVVARYMRKLSDQGWDFTEDEGAPPKVIDQDVSDAIKLDRD
jgi:uncharacterized membrane protein YkvA (DUF1232 family)